jgi:hypothetical protein
VRRIEVRHDEIDVGAKLARPGRNLKRLHVWVGLLDAVVVREELKILVCKRERGAAAVIYESPQSQ